MRDKFTLTPKRSYNLLLLCFFIIILFVSPSFAGTINFHFEQQGGQCIIVNRGDCAAYYPAIYQLGSDGQWLFLKPGHQQTMLPPGESISAVLVPIPTSTTAADLSYPLIILIRFFDEAGVSFGQMAPLRPPAKAIHKINAIYTGGKLRLAAPSKHSGIIATWVIAPFEEGVTPIIKTQDFTHRQPSAVRIGWKGQKTAEISTGAALPAAILLHESPSALSMQTIVKGRPKQPHRAAWLNRKRTFYWSAMLCAILGAILSLDCYRNIRRGMQS